MGRPSTGTRKHPVTLCLDLGLIGEIKKIGAVKGLSVSCITNNILEDYLTQNRKFVDAYDNMKDKL